MIGSVHSKFFSFNNDIKLYHLKRSKYENDPLFQLRTDPRHGMVIAKVDVRMSCGSMVYITSITAVAVRYRSHSFYSQTSKSHNLLQSNGFH